MAFARGDVKERIDRAERQIDILRRSVDEMKEQLRHEERERFVLVQFPGTHRRYCYEASEPCQIGDYCVVWSPMTNREEMVLVVDLGRGSWTGPNVKVARRVVYATTSDAVHHRFGPTQRECCDQEPF
jgi:hypothetical protein